MRITYTGPHDGVEIPALHQVVVRRGETIEVSDDLGASLIEQRVWEAEPGEIAAWVGDDPDRAARLLAAEKAADEAGVGRPDVIAQLELIADPPEPGGEPDPVPDPVPMGTAEEVLAWVQTNPSMARANRALMAELSGKNRSTLIAQLERLATEEVAD